MGNCRLLTVPESLFGGYPVLGSLAGMTLEVRFCEDGRVLLDQLNGGEADMCLIPAMLPGLDALEIAESTSWAGPLVVILPPCTNPAPLLVRGNTYPVDVQQCFEVLPGLLEELCCELRNSLR
jgi:CheY-like chemotaxis protein